MREEKTLKIRSKTIFGTKLFNYRFDKNNNNLKEIFNEWDIFISDSLNKGNIHFSITINIPTNYKNKEELHNILKMHPIEAINPEIGDYCGETKYSKYFFINDSLRLGECDNHTELYEYIYTIIIESKTVSWFFVTTEENKNGYLHLHGLFSMKNFMDYNELIKINISNTLKKRFSNCDILIKNLNRDKNIKDWVIYLHSEKIMVFQPIFYCINYEYFLLIKERFDLVYKKNYNLHNTPTDFLKKIYKNIEINDDIHLYVYCYFMEDFYFKGNGCLLKKNKITKETMIDLVIYFIILNNLYIYKKGVYEKIQGTQISYKFVDTLDNFIFNNFEKNIITFFSKNYPIHFEGFDFWYLIKTFKINSEEILLNINKLSLNILKVNFNLIEFNDGIYNTNQNKFKQFNQNKELVLVKQKNQETNFEYTNESTIKYYNKSFGWVRKTYPKCWRDSLLYALDNNEQIFLELCIFLGQILSFVGLPNETKERFLYVYGPTNTGKTTFLAKFLINYFTLDNVGFITEHSNFKFQDLNNKLIVILDEFKYDKKFRGDFLKLLSGETLLIPKKYEKEHIRITNNCGLILSNSFITEEMEKDEEVRKAMLARIKWMNLKRQLKNISKGINRNILDEESNIVIFCVKQYHSFVKGIKKIK